MRAPCQGDRGAGSSAGSTGGATESRRLAAGARTDIALAVLPGEDRDDPRLDRGLDLPPRRACSACSPFSAKAGARICARCFAASPAMPGRYLDAPKPQPCRAWRLSAGQGAVTLDQLAADACAGAPVVPILFYRSALLAADTAPIDALCEALGARGLAPAPLVVPSLKDRKRSDFRARRACSASHPAVIVTTTAFAAGGDGEASPLDGIDAPVLQAVIATTRRAAWQESPRGLGPADLAMHVVLPELDGRVLAGAIAFKDALPRDDALAFTAFVSRPEPDRIAMVADRIAALARLQQTPRNGTAYRRADARLSRRSGPRRLCRRARRAGKHPCAARRSRRSGIRGQRCSAKRRALLAAVERGGADATAVAARLSNGFSPICPARSRAHRSGMGRAGRRSRLPRRRLPLPRRTVRQCAGRASA